MIYLIIFMVLADGQATAYAPKQPTMQACEAKLPELRREVMGIESVRRYSLTCSRMEGRGEAMQPTLHFANLDSLNQSF